VQTTVDVLVIGSGAAGLSAALAARIGGANVQVIEKSGVLGGTSAMSGGVMWVPGHAYPVEGLATDSTSSALAYLRAATRGQVPDEPLAAYLRDAPLMLTFLEEHTTLSLAARADHPDYLPEKMGGRVGRGVEPQEWDSAQLGAEAARVRLSPSGWREGLLDVEKRKLAHGHWRAGRALVGALLHACLTRGVSIEANTRAVRLLAGNDDRITGALLDRGGRQVEVGVTGGVVLASGGFEWNPELVQAFLGVPMVAPVSSPSNTGDGLRMAMTQGARLGNMTQAWWTPALRVAEEYYEDGPLNRFVTQERSKPGSIVVNGQGHRFVRETLNYNDFGAEMSIFDGARYEYPNIPAYLVFDEACRRSYTMVGVEPGGPTPAWMQEAATLADLAAALSIDPAHLEHEVSAYNETATAGEDPRFRRGTTAYERYAGDPAVGGNGTIRPLTSGPYYAVEMQLGALGTKGGPVIDEHSRVIHVDGTPIPGLFAAGNVTASIMGPSYPGPGVTLGPAIVHGIRAGRAAATKAGNLASY
jgi:3-oxosteroid 1-dehydrogenase